MQKVRLEEIFYLKTGSTPSTKNDKYWNNGTIPWFTVKDIKFNGQILYKSLKYITPNSIRNKIASKNSFIVGTTATVGIHALIKVDFYTNQQFSILTLKDEYKDKFNIFYLNYYCFVLDKYCLNNSHHTGIGFLSVSKATLKKFVFPIIPLSAQQHIVDTIDYLFLFPKYF